MPLLRHPKIARTSNRCANLVTNILRRWSREESTAFWGLLLEYGYGSTFISSLFLSILPSLAQAQIPLRSCKLCQKDPLNCISQVDMMRTWNCQGKSHLEEISGKPKPLFFNESFDILKTIEDDFVLAITIPEYLLQLMLIHVFINLFRFSGDYFNEINNKKVFSSFNVTFL